MTYEIPGAFYLGKRYDNEKAAITDELVLYDAKDLSTHALCVGMTGSGKTGLCVSLLEEAAIDGIPALVIDPKGDLGALMLTFPELTAEAFAPWIDAEEALRAGSDPAAHAAATAQRWREGLAQWGQDASRIRTLREKADIAIYTPGASAGLQLSLLGSLAPPAGSDLHARQDRAKTVVSGLLALIGMESDPLRSREHILLTNIIDQAWRAGEELDLAALITDVQSPPFDRLGVLDLETFFPAKDRSSLALTLNGLLASPSFSRWLEGEPLEIDRLLYTAERKPRISILSIAHLNDAERMFFVTTLLGELTAWMRLQSGTSSLRALLYMDEVAGYLPPVSSPPSKALLLGLLKQARAFGVGLVLATQNPVDLDYKALSNAGTWLIGRLQTAQDVERVVDGLAGAALAAGATFNKQALIQEIAGLKKRVFLMNSVHEREPVLMHSRWALSFLRGPLTGVQIAKLMAGRKAGTTLQDEPDAMNAQLPGIEPGSLSTDTDGVMVAPLAQGCPRPANIETYCVYPRKSNPEATFVPSMIAKVTLHYVDTRAGLDSWQESWCTVPLLSASAEKPRSSPQWDALCFLDPAVRVGANEDFPGRYIQAPVQAEREKSYVGWKKMLKTKLYQRSALSLYRERRTKEVSEVGEGEEAFRGRVEIALREGRDSALAKLREKYAKRIQTLEERIQRAHDKVERERAQYSQRRTDAAVTIGASLLGAFLGRKIISGTSARRAATAVRSAGRAAREKGDIGRAEEQLAAQHQRLKVLEAELSAKLETVRADFSIDEVEITRKSIKPRKADITVEHCGLGWLPQERRADGSLCHAFATVAPQTG